jgi:hypothetical protein
MMRILVARVLTRICCCGNARGNGDKGHRKHERKQTDPFSEQTTVRNPVTNYIVTLKGTVPSRYGNGPSRSRSRPGGEKSP